ncbi:enoyl-CoA hydratase-related protein [Rhodococcus sp. DMU1]|uniref:enoyl-CoA hydratase/isomerase family protein n=1 Tax=Rhodococcus sp. DMU1 TaxID=2722825 RepID=UPI00143ED36C|nr:enoyl-CoA hydratase-related protein [Rhodococcus sp. DMU1]QIX53699.1 crotonase/enoyl-CoA hydratase family protein [Rhodococcus sp. DMU1]
MTALITEVSGHVGIMTLNRPEKHNAMNAEIFVKMAEAWEEWALDPQVRTVIVTGAGDKAFSAGADLSSVVPVLTRARAPQNEYESILMDTHPKIRDAAMLRTYFPKPIIAAVNGFCLAGGTELIQGTDIRICVEGASFGLPEVKRAIVPAGGSLVRLSRQMPFARAMEMILTGEPISASEALSCGFVNAVTAPDQLMDTALKIAHQINENGPVAVAAAKRAIIETSGMTLDEAFVIEDRAWDVVSASADAKEGPLAFMEKRRPVYIGR